MNEAQASRDTIFLDPGGSNREDPLCAFERWLLRAKDVVGFAASAMSLATATPDGMPDVRIVLLQSVREGGLVFFTNLDSAKGSQIVANPRAAACFHWPAIGRQVRVRGSVAQVDPSFADLYFGGRQDGDQIGVIDGIRSTFGKTYAAEPDVLIEQLKDDAAIQAADTLMLTIPSQLGVEFNLRVVETFATQVAPALGWVGTRP